MDNEIKSSDVVLISNGHPLCEISIKTLVGYLEANGINCRSIYINSTAELKTSEIQQLLKLCHGSKLVGFSIMSKDVKKLLPLVNTIRKTGIPVVWGGVHPTASPEDSLKYCDFICTGEGEFALLSLYREIVSGNKNFSSIPNLGFNKDSIPVLPAIFRTEASLDDLPYPDYKFLDGYFFKKGLVHKVPSSIDERKTFFGMSLFLFYSARGCNNACTYCSNSLYHQIAKTTKTKWYRTLSPARIKDEVRQHLKYLPVDFFWFNDDDFIPKDWIHIAKND